MQTFQFCQPFGYYRRFPSHEVVIGNVKMGGNNPIVIQSMTNTPTSDVKATVNQCIELASCGCELIRITTRNLDDVKAFSEISKDFKLKGFHQPLAADVHYSPIVAKEVSKYAEKIRINPGNYTDISKSSKKTSFSETDFNEEKCKIADELIPLINECKKNGTAIRLGINHGSLAWRMVERYGNSAKGMVETAIEFLEIFEDQQFKNVVVSLKASNPLTLVFANRLMVETMNQKGMTFPIHVGVTEAGFGDEGILRSAGGIGALLVDGIGDTIRVSLSGNPVKEIPVAKQIVEYSAQLSQYIEKNDYQWPVNPFIHKDFNLPSHDFYKNITPPFIVGDSNVSDVLSLNDSWVLNSNKEISIKKDENFIQYIKADAYTSLHEIREQWLKTNPNLSKILQIESVLNPIKAAIVCGSLLTDKLIAGLNCNIENENDISQILKSLGLRTESAVYVACPTCGRTQFDLEKLAIEVKEKTQHLHHIKIAIMGCIVNGPGEMEDADFGIIGQGPHVVGIFKKDIPIFHKIPVNQAVEKLIELLTLEGRWDEK